MKNWLQQGSGGGDLSGAPDNIWGKAWCLPREALEGLPSVMKSEAYPRKTFWRQEREGEAEKMLGLITAEKPEAWKQSSLRLLKLSCMCESWISFLTCGVDWFKLSLESVFKIDERPWEGLERWLGPYEHSLLLQRSGFSVTSTNNWWTMVAFNFSSWASNVLFWPPREPRHPCGTYVCRKVLIKHIKYV